MTRAKSKVRWLIGSIVVVSAVVWMEFRHLGLASASDQLQEQLRLARAEGLPVEPSDLRRNTVPDDQNAGQLIANTYQMAKELPGDPLYLVTGYQSSPPTDSQVRKALSDLEPVFESAVEASLRPHLDMHWRWELGADMIQSEPSQVKALARGLISRANKQDADKKWPQATASMLAAVRLERLLREDPTVSAQLAQIAIESSEIQTAADMLRRHSGDRESTEFVQALIKAMGDMPDIRFGLRGELVTGRIGLRQIAYWNETHRSAGGYYDDGMGFGAEGYLMRINSIADLNDAALVADGRDLVKALPRDPSDIQRSQAAIETFHRKLDSETGIGHLFTGLFVGFGALDSWLACLARRRVLLAGAEILVQESRTGAFPEHWSKSDPDGIDPFTNKALVYHRTNRGFVIYSLDRDRKDDGGRPFALDDVATKDISFEYPTLSLRPPAPPHVSRPPSGPGAVGGD